MVYITSDLFGPTTTHDREHRPSPTFRQHMTTAQYPAGLGKRRRHDEEERPSINNHESRPWLPPSEWDSRPPPLGRDNTPSFALYSATMNTAASERRPFKQLKRLMPKAVLVKSTSHLMDIEPDLAPTAQLAVTDLRPCHACNLAPKRKKDLVNYLDCNRCDGRTCYVCARECLGGCGQSVCKKCVVEVGKEGDPWCLGCYSRHINS